MTLTFVPFPQFLLIPFPTLIHNLQQVLSGELYRFSLQIIAFARLPFSLRNWILLIIFLFFMAISTISEKFIKYSDSEQPQFQSMTLCLGLKTRGDLFCPRRTIA